VLGLDLGWRAVLKPGMDPGVMEPAERGELEVVGPSQGPSQ